jgi:hypothetical protein
VDQQKSKRNLYRKLVKRGVARAQAAKTVYSHHKRWKLSNTFAVNKAYPVGSFTGEMGQAIRSDRQLAHWFELFIIEYDFREEPCTDPYARFCGQTEAAASSDPIIMSNEQSRDWHPEAKWWVRCP